MILSNYIFSEIFPDIDSFKEQWNTVGLPMTDVCTSDDPFVNVVFYSLYARYGNSQIASTDSNRFIYGVMSVCYNSGPTVRKKLEIQKSLRDLTVDDLTIMSQSITNQAANPSQSPATTSDTILPFIDAQVVNKGKSGKLAAYAGLLSLQDESVMYDFINKFKFLFKTTPQPEQVYLFAEEE